MKIRENYSNRIFYFTVTLHKLKTFEIPEMYIFHSVVYISYDDLESKSEIELSEIPKSEIEIPKSEIDKVGQKNR